MKILNESTGLIQCDSAEEAEKLVAALIENCDIKCKDCACMRAQLLDPKDCGCFCEELGIEIGKEECEGPCSYFIEKEGVAA